MDSKVYALGEVGPVGRVGLGIRGLLSRYLKSLFFSLTLPFLIKHLLKISHLLVNWFSVEGPAGLSLRAITHSPCYS